MLRVLLSPSSHSSPGIFVVIISPRPVQNSSAYIFTDLLVLEVYFQPALSAVHQRLIGFSPEVKLHALPVRCQMNAEEPASPCTCSALLCSNCNCGNVQTPLVHGQVHHGLESRRPYAFWTQKAEQKSTCTLYIHLMLEILLQGLSMAAEVRPAPQHRSRSSSGSRPTGSSPCTAGA